MALACPVLEHPVGDGSFCRICGRDYVAVPDPVTVQTAVLEAPPAVLPESSPFALPEPSPFAELHQPAPEPAPEPLSTPDPVLDTGLIDTRFAEMTAPEASLGELASATTAPAEEPVAKTSRPAPPYLVHVLAGAGGGALVMALLDRLVL